MAYNIKGGFDAIKRYAIDDDGDYKLQSLWTHSDTIELPGGKPLTNMVNRGVYIDTDEESPESVQDDLIIDDTTVSTERVWSSSKTQTEIGNLIDNTRQTNTNTWSSSKIKSEMNAGVASAEKLAVDGEELNVGSFFSPVFFSHGIPVRANMVFYGIQQLPNGRHPYTGIFPPILVLIGRALSGDMVAAFIDNQGTISYLKQNDSLATVSYTNDNKLILWNKINDTVSVLLFGMNVD